MAVYFDQKIQGPQGGTYTLTQFHKVHQLLAVGSYGDGVGGSVQLYANGGEHVADCKGLQRMSQPTHMHWHPTKKVLAVGWESGEVLIWNEHDHELYEVTHLHKSDIKAVHWTSNGTRLLTVDTTGLVAMWKTDSRGRPQQSVLCQHHLNEPITDIVIRPPAVSDAQLDIASLARAAVSGDESALDMFNWKKGRSGMRIGGSMMGPQEATCFFLGGKNGGVFYLNENMKVVQVFMADGPVRSLLYYDEKHILVTVTTTMMMSQHMVSPEGDTREMLKVKMSGKSQNPCMVWAGKGVLATATGESIVRMWDLDKEENYVLNLEGQPGYDINEFITCISFCHNKGVLAGGTGAGHVAMWQFSPIVKVSPVNKPEPEDHWKLQPPSTIEGAISSLCWGSTKNLLAVNTVENVYVLTEQIMSTSYRDQVAVVQSSPTQMSIDMFAISRHHDVKTDIQIKYACNSKEAIGVLDGKRALVYEIVQEGVVVRVAGSFSTETPTMSLYEQNVYTLEPGKVQVRTFQGTVKQLINFSEAEGDPSGMEICAHFLVISSATGTIKIFDLSRREAKQHGSTKNLADVIPDFGVLVSAKCNMTGSKVSAVLTKHNGAPEPRLYIWDVELDTVQYFNLETGRGEQDEYMNQGNELDADVSDADKGKNQAAKDIAGRHPISHQWDSKEQKLLVCEARLLPVGQSKSNNSNKNSVGKGKMEEQVEVMVVSLFVTPENGILIQDSFEMPTSHNRLIGLEVPYYYFMKKAEEANDGAPQVPESGGVVQQSSGFQRLVTRLTMRDFVGLESADKNAIDAMMNFSYFLTIGNMDEAFKAIKLIKSESVWENMAKMCVKTRRLDVATVCLGNMGHARGAKAVREAMAQPELDARVASLAIHLGLQEDAERLLKNSKRYDLLNDYYQSSGQWGKAMETAEMFDRVHLRTTYYNYAKHLEAKGDINGAIPNYEKSETYRFEVPRMLFDEPQALEGYIAKKKDPLLLKWWAQYMESTGEMDTALLNYELSQDYLSLVRVYCYCGNMEKAAEICNETGDKAACYHLGRQYENNDMIREAIHFFTRASAYGNAIRLCKEHGMEDQLMNLALLARPESMMNAARYYEFKPGCQDKAVMLYHKAGNFSKALDLAFTSKQFGALQMISEDLDETTDPELLQRCADFFTENSQFDRAVDLLGAAKKYWDALKLCMEQHVPMTEELVEKLTPPKEVNENEAEERNKILEGIAEVCMQQRQYHLATKKYTQSGNKVKAMKALLKSGDTEKIVFFAGVSRQKEIYVMAANYLQSLDWRKDPEIMKSIISFYTKGRALELLAGFYDACAQVEVDEYQNYDKALGALNEAYKCMSKAKMKNQSLQEERLGEIKHKMMLIKKFVTARRTYEDDAEEGVKQCQVLLEEPNLELGVRMGDVYGFIVEHFAKREKWKAAYACIEDMRSRLPKVNLAYYVNMRTIEAIHRALDIPMPKGTVGAVNGVSMGGGEEEDGEEVEEDVVDDFPNDDSNC